MKTILTKRQKLLLNVIKFHEPDLFALHRQAISASNTTAIQVQEKRLSKLTKRLLK